jgi:hypothetical protein
MILITLPLINCGGGGEDRTLRIQTLIGTTPASADWVAFQDGSGAWTPLSARSSGNYETTVASSDGKYGVAIAHTMDGISSVRIIHATLNEIRQITLEIGKTTPPIVKHKITGTVSGVIQGRMGFFQVKDSYDGKNGATDYTLEDVAPGTFDLLGMRGAGDVIDKMILYRDLVVNADVTRNMDFNGVTSFVPTGFTVTLTDGGTNKHVGWGLMTNRGTSHRRSFNSTTMPGYGFPPDQRHPNDIYWAWGREIHDPGTGAQTRQSRVYFRTPVSQTLTLPASFAGTVTEAVTTPYVRLKADWTPYTEVSLYYLEAISIFDNWKIYLSTGWAGSATTYTVPDFQTVTGWNNQWGFASGDYERAFWAVKTNRSVSDYLRLDGTQNWPDGTQISYAGPI